LGFAFSLLAGRADVLTVGPKLSIASARSATRAADGLAFVFPVSPRSTGRRIASARVGLSACLAAGIAAGSAVLIGAAATVAAPAIASHGGPDPILAAIEAYRRAATALNEVYRRHADLEESLPSEMTRTSISVWEEKIVETDAPEWIASERAVMAGHNAETDAALEICCIEPTTIAGVVAVLDFTIENPQRYGSQFPEFFDDDDIARSFEHFIIQNCAAALAKLSVAAGGVG